MTFGVAVRGTPYREPTVLGLIVCPSQYRPAPILKIEAKIRSIPLRQFRGLTFTLNKNPADTDDFRHSSFDSSFMATLSDFG